MDEAKVVRKILDEIEDGPEWLRERFQFSGREEKWFASAAKRIRRDIVETKNRDERVRSQSQADLDSGRRRHAASNPLPADG